MFDEIEIHMRIKGVGRGLGCCGFNDFDLIIGEAVELVDEAVDFPVGGLDLTLDDRPLVGGLGFGYP